MPADGSGKNVRSNAPEGVLHCVPGILARCRASPWGGEIGRRQRILRIFVGNGAIRGGFAIPAGILGAAVFSLESFGDKVIQHPRAGLSARAELAGNVGTDRTGVRLARAKLP